MKCALCKKLALEQYKPFCSKRCADIDLHRWTAGVYSVPVEDGGYIPIDDDDEY